MLHESPSLQLIIFLHPFLFFPVFRKTDFDVPTTNGTSRKTHDESPSATQEQSSSGSLQPRQTRRTPWMPQLMQNLITNPPPRRPRGSCVDAVLSDVVE